MNIKLTIAYDGTRYLGWQRLGGQLRQQSIQGYIEEVLSVVLKSEIRVTGSGRTDRGVHAMGQVVNFHVKKLSENVADLPRLCNDRLPEDIRVLRAEQVNARFHARRSAREKTYCYRLDTRSVPCVFERKYALWVPESLCIDRMEEAARLLEGTHDFAAFSTGGEEREDTVRTIYAIRFLKEPPGLVIAVCGDGFLYNMVRILVGTLLEVGKGERTLQQIEEALSGRDRKLAGQTVSSVGLFLKEVVY